MSSRGGVTCLNPIQFSLRRSLALTRKICEMFVAVSPSRDSSIHWTSRFSLAFIKSSATSKRYEFESNKKSNDKTSHVWIKFTIKWHRWKANRVRIKRKALQTTSFHFLFNPSVHAENLSSPRFARGEKLIKFRLKHFRDRLDEGEKSFSEKNWGFKF